MIINRGTDMPEGLSYLPEKTAAILSWPQANGVGTLLDHVWQEGLRIANEAAHSPMLRRASHIVQYTRS